MVHYADEALSYGAKVPSHLISAMDELLAKADDGESKSSMLGIMAKFTKITPQRTELAKNLFLKE